MLGAGGDPKSELAARTEGTLATTFGKYEVVANLGRGGMADVFLAFARGQMGDSKLAVIKRLRQTFADEPNFRTMFLDEARLASRLSHPNIVYTYEVGEEQGAQFIAMEYLEGQPLNALLKEIVLRDVEFEPEVAVRIIADALSGLAYAHTLCDYDGRPLGIVHRDVSPHNIFVTYDGYTKLVDFGIAKAALSSTETEVGVLKGKIAYMSPEQVVGGPIDQRADLFAMGIVLWELLARRRLMSGENAANTLHKLMNEPIASLSSVMPDIDPTLEAVVARALEKTVEARFQSAVEMRDALEDWLRTRGRLVRQDEIGQRMVSLFGGVREEVRQHVQKYILDIASDSGVLRAGARLGEAAVSSNPLISISDESFETSVGTNTFVHDPRSETNTHSPSTVSGPPAANKHPANQALSIVVACGFFVLSGILIVVIGLRERTGALASEGRVLARNSVPTVGTDTLPSTPASAAIASAPNSPAPAFSVTAPPRSFRAASTGASSSAGRMPYHSTPAVEEPGFLTISVYPWATVSEGGRVLCAATPCNKIPLSPGLHTLQLENPDQGMKQATTVMIKSGGTTTRAIGLR